MMRMAACSLALLRQKSCRCLSSSASSRSLHHLLSNTSRSGPSSSSAAAAALLAAPTHLPWNATSVSSSLPSCTSRRTISTHYYDSQSGLHVPIHQENDIYIYKHWSISTSTNNKEYQQLYKHRDVAEDVTDELLSYKNDLSVTYQGMVITHPLIFPRDVRNLETLHHLLQQTMTTTTTTTTTTDNDNEFTIFAPSLPERSITTTTTTSDSSGTTTSNDTNTNDLVVLCDYSNITSHQLQSYKDQGVRTTIQISNYGNNDDSSSSSDRIPPPPFELANQIATLLDESGGGDHIWIHSYYNSGGGATTNENLESIFELCEELSYLDVPGPIMKSRLILDCPPSIPSLVDDHDGDDDDDDQSFQQQQHDLIDEVMNMGVNKFVIYQEEQRQIKLLQNAMMEQGKQFVSHK